MGGSTPRCPREPTTNTRTSGLPERLHESLACFDSLRRDLGNNTRIRGKSNLQELDAVADVAADQLQPAIRIVCPDDSNLLHLQAKALRQPQDLDVAHV